jgi:hypothetical protein
MDLRLYGRVVWRFRLLVVLGFLVAVALAVLSFARVSFAGGSPKLSYRSAVTYGSSETLLITQQGFPEGRSIFPYKVTKDGPVTPFADPSRFASLAAFYAYLANSDVVAQLVRKQVGRTVGSYSAGPVVSPVGNQAVQPLIRMQGISTSPAAAIRYARSGSFAFRSYLARQQADQGIPENQRVVISVLNRAEGAVLLAPRKKTVPIVVFVAVMAATLALTLLLENLRPRIKAVEARQIDYDVAEGNRSTG